MSNSKRRYRKHSERRIFVRGERHDPPDTYLLSRALLDMALEMAAKVGPGAATQPPTEPQRDQTPSQERQS